VIPSGVITLDAGQIQEQVTNEYLAIFGNDLNTDPSTPQGMLIQAEVAARIAVANNNCAVANQINPNQAGGVYLDALCALFNVPRASATYSTLVGVIVTGVAGTIIPAGSLATVNGSGQNWQTVSNVTIPISGMANVNFTAVNSGEIACAVGALTTVVSAVLGWETVYNPVAAMLGSAQGSDYVTRNDRASLLYNQGYSTAGAIISAVKPLTGVTGVFLQENVQPTYQVINGVTMLPNSIFVCVNGGNDLEVATTIQSKKSAGCAYSNGNFTQTGTLSTSTSQVTGLSDTSLMSVGMTVTGNGIPFGTTISVITNATTISLTALPTINGTSSLTFNSTGVIKVVCPSFVLNGTTVLNSNAVSGLSSTNAIYIGMPVSGIGIQAGTTVASIVNLTDITLSLPATAANTGTPLTFSFNVVDP
jgi:hypothetical protein